jgi:hypothetical protein
MHHTRYELRTEHVQEVLSRSSKLRALRDAKARRRLTARGH